MGLFNKTGNVQNIWSPKSSEHLWYLHKLFGWSFFENRDSSEKLASMYMYVQRIPTRSFPSSYMSKVYSKTSPIAEPNSWKVNNYLFLPFCFIFLVKTNGLLNITEHDLKQIQIATWKSVIICNFLKKLAIKYNNYWL